MKKKKLIQMIIELYKKHGLLEQFKSYLYYKLVYHGKLCVTDRMGDLDMTGKEYVNLVNSLPHDKLLLEQKFNLITYKIDTIFANKISDLYNNVSLSATQISTEVSILIADKQSMLNFINCDFSSLGML
jgi:hypothetical protein